MISNDRVQALLATDRETLIDLLAVAYARGGMGGGLWDVWIDPDIRPLMDEAQARCRRPVKQDIAAWNSWAQSPEQQQTARAGPAVRGMAGALLSRWGTHV